MILSPESTENLWPVYKGASLNLWQPDTGEYYAWADPAHIEGVLQDKRKKQARRSSSVFSGFPPSWLDSSSTLPCNNARIAWRRIARATDSRTCIAALIPPGVILQDTAPYFVLVEGSARDEAFILGVLSSMPLDWYARRIVEAHMDFHVIDAFPIPDTDQGSLRNRVTEIAGRIASVDERFSDWAEKAQVPIGSLNGTAAREDALAELDALVALLYDLEEKDLVHIYQTFHPTWDPTSRMEAALPHFRAWKDKA